MLCVRIYGKAGCGKCEAAKATIGEKMGLEYEYMDISELVSGKPPSNWRDMDAISIMAAYLQLNTLPLIQVNNEEITTYPAAIKRLKELRSKAEVIRVFSDEVNATELIAV